LALTLAATVLYTIWGEAGSPEALVTATDPVNTVILTEQYLNEVTRILRIICETPNEALTSERIHAYIQILGQMTTLHERVFEFSSVYITILEQDNSPLFNDFNDLFELWREVGNDIVTTLRAYEGAINVSPNQSAYSARWFENFGPALERGMNPNPFGDIDLNQYDWYQGNQSSDNNQDNSQSSDDDQDNSST
jgi:hypothetical protein